MSSGPLVAEDVTIETVLYSFVMLIFPAANGARRGR